jgi:hypothetical protein
MQRPQFYPLAACRRRVARAFGRSAERRPPPYPQADANIKLVLGSCRPFYTKSDIRTARRFIK